MSEPLPCGTWPSRLSAAAVAAGALRLSQVRIADGVAHWLEGRPEEAGRQVVCAGRAREAPRECTPTDVSVRARVHEYGGGDYSVGPHGLAFVDDRGIHVEREGGFALLEGTAADARYAEPIVSPDGRWLVAVEERPGEPEATNRLVAFPRAGGVPVAFAVRHDFVSSPCFSPDGTRLAYLCWEHPDMPWDATVLRELPFAPEGPAGEARTVAGGPGESVFQPGYSPAGHLSFVSDRDGFWNLFQERDGAVRALHPAREEFGVPQWVLGLSTWGFVDEERIAAVVRADGRDRAVLVDLAGGALRELDVPLCAVGSLAADGERIALIGSGPDRLESVFELRLSDGRFAAVRPEAPAPLDPDDVSPARAFAYDVGDAERAHGFYYAPRNRSARPRDGERPPLVVKIHGGPTAAASAGFDPGIQYWTQRGFGLVDVNHRGSTGFGRAFRERLYGEWGLVEVEDCVAAARALAHAGEVDGERMVIRGGSAGGFTVLCALAFHDVFAGGCSRYGVSDLAALAADTHKFESRYTDRLVAPWPEGREVYRERSPLHHADRLGCPVIFFQGLDDRVVPPSQTEAIVAALARRNVPHAYVAFAGEGHGFRRAENLVTCLEGERWFYGQALGFDAGPAPDGVVLR